MSVANLGYIILRMAKPDDWVAFGANILGMRPVDQPGPGGERFLRMDEAPFRYMIIPADQEGAGDREGYVAAGWDAGDEATFDLLCRRLETAGMPVTEGQADDATLRAVERFVITQDPAGNRFELFYGRKPASEPYRATKYVKEFITGEMGLGHLVLPAPEIEAVSAFYCDLLGFGISDDLVLPPPGDGLPNQRILFLHADNPRHHSLGLYNFDTPSGVVHIMAEVGTLDEVGLAMDRAKEAGVPFLASLGRHSNDNMVSFYVMAPGGIGFEFGYDGLQVQDWSAFTATQSTSGDIWGHDYQFPRGEG
tara:strand:+ start:4768 stop:5691 length:924 start_codon:yes stop_codon:yes gene_type:complete